MTFRQGALFWKLIPFNFEAGSYCQYGKRTVLMLEKPPETPLNESYLLFDNASRYRGNGSLFQSLILTVARRAGKHAFSHFLL
jgi:hypothetical protein